MSGETEMDCRGIAAERIELERAEEIHLTPAFAGFDLGILGL
jgi:hypothetical protein